MAHFYKNKQLKSIGLALCLVLCTTFSFAQLTTFNTTIGSTGYTGTNNAGSGLTAYVSFAIANNSGGPVKLVNVGNWSNSATNTTYTLYYSATALSGPVDLAQTATWTSIATGTSSVTASALSVNDVLSNINFVIPANTTYRFALQKASGTNYYSGSATLGSATPNIFTSVSLPGCSLLVNEFQINSAYVGYCANNSPRAFTGSVTVEKLVTGGNNASIASLIEPKTFCPFTSQDVKVRLRNAGSNIINNVAVQWTLNGVLQAALYWTQPLDTPGGALPSDTVVTLGTAFFGTSAQTLTAWTEYPNSVADTVNSDDTLTAILRPALSGAYTIGGTTPSFATIEDAVTALNAAGVCGPVIFNVTSGSGPYTSSLSFENIAGVSATNTITFNGNGATISSANSPVVAFNNVSYITLDSFTIQQTGTTGFGVMVSNGCHHLTFNRNIIEVGTTSTAATNAGFVASSSVTAPTTAGNNLQYLTFTNNTVIGGYYSFTLMGNTGQQDNYGHYIANNIFRDFYAYGPYLGNADTTTFTGNEIHRLGRSSVATTSYITYLATSRFVKYTKNRIHDVGGSTVYPIYLTNCANTAGYETSIINNLIYNLGNTGTMYGIYSLTTAISHVNIYHNTIQHNIVSGSSTIRAIFLSVAITNVNLKNNIISITGAGTGVKTGVYITTTSATFRSNNNNIYVNTSASNNVGYWSAARASLADWSTASGQDLQSKSVDPQFVSVSTGDLMPLALASINPATSINDIGTPVGVTTDITGALRSSATPDPGAYETLVRSTNNASVSAFIGPKNFCGGIQDVKVRIRNNGVNVINYVTVQWMINGVMQAPVSWTYPMDTLKGPNYPSDTVISLGSVFFTNKRQALQVWTEYPNSVADTVNNDDTLNVEVMPTMHGAYTIGGSTADFASIGDAVNALKTRGVCAPVVFTTLNDTSTYWGTITFQGIAGLSAVNTVTFNGNGDTIPSTATPILDFNGISYISLDSFVVMGAGSGYVGVGIRVGGASHHLTFNRNVVSVSTASTTSTSNVAFAASNSLTTATTAGNNAQYLTITNNMFVGGYYCLTLMGNTGSLDNYGHYIANNTFKDFYLYGAYLSNADTVTFINNDINRSSRASVSTLYGIYATTSRYLKIQKNRIHDCGVSSYGAYPIYLSNCVNAAGYETEVSNNLIYNVGTTSTFYGIYSLTTAITGVNFYHNTIQHDIASGSGTVRGAFFSVAVTDVNFKNNIISITGAGTGVKTGIYVATPSATFNSNNNLIQVVTSAAGTDNVGFWGTENASLLDWQQASLQDMLSKTTDPSFTNVASGNLKPLTVSIDNMGTGVGITTDVLGAARALTTPDVGAYEFTTASSCSGKPEAGEAISTMGYVCSGNTFNLGLVNDSVALGLRYRWQVSSGQTGPFVDMPNDTVKNITATQSATKWYRAVLTCNTSGQADTSVAVRVRTTTSVLNGTYTLNNTLPVSASNYTSFTDLTDELNCNGIAGPVVINVAPGSGPYEGGFMFANIPGVSSTNTITINGNGATVTSVRSSSAIIRFNQAAYITMQNLNIMGDSIFDGFGVHITGASHHLTLHANTIDLGMTVTTSTCAGIVASGTLSSATTAGNNVNHLTLTNNTVIGGYYSVTLIGNASYLDNYNHTITNNTLRDFYLYGLYMVNADSVIVSNNDINRSLRPAVSTFYGLYGSSVRNTKYRNNRIHDAGNGSYTAYPVYMTGSSNSAGFETELINNAVYNIPTTGTIYGYYLLGTRDRLKFYHNTIDLKLSSGSTGTIRGLYMSTAPNNHDFKNNIISVSGTGSGEKHLIYVAATSTSIASDRNILYIDTTVSTNYVGYLTTDIKSISGWKAASLVDQNSIGNDPVFANLTGGDPVPLSVNCDNLGTNVGVTTDLTGAARSATTPDAGAFEFTGINGDIGLTEGKLVRADVCYSNADTAFFTIKNMLGTTVDFSINPLTLQWSANGPANSSGSISISTGTLSVGSTLTVYATSVNRTLPGDYTVSAYIQSNAVNVSTTNDTLYAGDVFKVLPILSVTAKTFNVNSPTDSVAIQAVSPLFPGAGVFFSEVVHYKTTNGAPAGGWPSYLLADDYVELTGVPGSDLAGYIMEEWTGTTLQHSVTFPPNTLFGPNGTMVIATGQLTGSVPVPSSYYYHSGNTATHSSTGDLRGYVIKTSGGVIVDAVTYGAYTFPAASGVTSLDWSGSTPAVSSSGNKLNGPDNNTGSNWVNSGTVAQDPNVLNANVNVPSPTALTGFSWSLNGSQVSSSPRYIAGPYTVPGTYQYIASYTNACGTFYDTVIVNAGPGVPVKLTSFTATATGNDVYVRWQTASEKNSAFFEVYRSTDTRNWEVIGKIKAAGNSSMVKNYVLADPGALNINAKAVYYRLKSVDHDGTFEWSDYAIVTLNKGESGVGVYPNPFNTRLVITVPSDDQTDVVITTLQGKTIVHTLLTVENHKVTLQDLENLDAGIYFIKITQNGVSHVEKLVKN